MLFQATQLKMFETRVHGGKKHELLDAVEVVGIIMNIAHPATIDGF